MKVVAVVMQIVGAWKNSSRSYVLVVDLNRERRRRVGFGVGAQTAYAILGVPKQCDEIGLPYGANRPDGRCSERRDARVRFAWPRQLLGEVRVQGGATILPDSRGETIRLQGNRRRS